MCSLSFLSLLAALPTQRSDLFVRSVLPAQCGVAGGLPACDAEGPKERTSCPRTIKILFILLTLLSPYSFWGRVEGRCSGQDKLSVETVAQEALSRECVFFFPLQVNLNL